MGTVEVRLSHKCFFSLPGCNMFECMNWRNACWDDPAGGIAAGWRPGLGFAVSGGIDSVAHVAHCLLELRGKWGDRSSRLFISIMGCAGQSRMRIRSLSVDWLASTGLEVFICEVAMWRGLLLMRGQAWKAAAGSCGMLDFQEAAR